MIGGNDMLDVSKYLTGMSALLLLVACQPEPPAFALPEGDVERGQALFVEYQCTACHTVRDLDLPAPTEAGPVKVSLGGRVSKLATYEELVTSIVNPSHKLVRFGKAEELTADGESLMAVYNDVMTVTDLIDLVAFLDSRYEEFERPGYRYTLHNE